MPTPFNEMADDGNHQTIAKIVHNFVARPDKKSLNPLRLASLSVSEFSTELANHLSTINEGGSIALGRGEKLASISLSKSLESLFSTSTPHVTEGPPLTWTKLVLFAGPNFEGPTQLKIDNSSVELPEYDLKLLRSGRPWRFLSPWPDRDDCTKELQSSETALQELSSARKVIDEVLAQILLVEQRLRNHRGLVSQIFESRDHAIHRGKISICDGAQPFAQPFVPTQGAFGPGPLAEGDSIRYRDSPTIPVPIHYASKAGSAQPVNEDPNDQAPLEDATVRNPTQHDDFGHADGTRPESRLHTSDFIQNLSEILDDPNSWEVMRWSEDGKSVLVGEESIFPPHMLAKMSTKSYQSLIRRLYYYGFHKIGGAYHHNSFIRGQPSSIRPAREMSHSPSLPSPLHKSSSQGGPRYKVIKRKRKRDSV
ncbi:hypothetical protein N7499_003208 [Penicillium canescens]|uniref:HSF-type DNA-binding domain-containing protein n=1 Tax=Penicillium canescens TaxID=5083 RepID=A0AAD6I5B3_PENCN|nr:uncharacterized protein N7446_014168 [Penicillium canescens]KAJ6034187.1 hypothetical protein N7460_009899 [Penicillium canescens]KAJ6038926.1 hypothetical protein N7446_014168 [Penicillium canescens]KAJ6047300.1 hypothetical protein N7444_007086 [Penicillium canescens]KAJ6047305.1 hypothetical protein N7444_007085 [Penicillium canescens]KAJ6091057.1 hypothetical protein N7499_003208 [Penicillium canescens]